MDDDFNQMPSGESQMSPSEKQTSPSSLSSRSPSPSSSPASQVKEERDPRVKGKKSKRIYIKTLPCKTVKLDNRKVNSLAGRIDYCIEQSSSFCSEKLFKTSTRSSPSPSSTSPSTPTSSTTKPSQPSSSSSWCTMTARSTLGLSKNPNIHTNHHPHPRHPNLHRNQQSARSYQRSQSEDITSSKLLDASETSCCPTDAPTIAQALWRPLWPPGWRPRGSSSSTNKCNTNSTSANINNSNNNKSNSDINRRATTTSNKNTHKSINNQSHSNNIKSEFTNITINTGNTLKNIFKRPLIVMSEHREDPRSGGSSGISVSDVIKSGKTLDHEEGGKRGTITTTTDVDSGCVSVTEGGKESVNDNNGPLGSGENEKLNQSNCTSSYQSKSQQSPFNLSPSSGGGGPSNRLVTLSTGRLRLGPTSNDVSSSMEELESMEAWLDEHPKFFCEYVIRKAPRSTIDAWILAHSIPHSAGSSCGTNSSASAPASGSATPVRKISAHEFEKGSLFLPPMVSTTEEGIPTFLQPPPRDDFHPTFHHSSSHSSTHHQQQSQHFISNLTTSDYSYLNSNTQVPTLTLRQPFASSTTSTSSSSSSSSASAAAMTAALQLATSGVSSSSSPPSSNTTNPITATSSSPLTDISSLPSSSIQRTRSQFDGLDEKQLIFELVKDICNDLDVVSLNHKILKNVSLLTNADRCSLFLVKGEPGDPNRHFVPTLFDVSSESAASTTPSNNKTSDDPSFKPDSIKVPWGRGIVGYVAESGESVIIDDCYKDPRFSDLVDQMTGFKTRNMLCSPIFDNFGQVMGVAQVINKLPKSRLSIPTGNNSLAVNLSVGGNNSINSTNTATTMATTTIPSPTISGSSVSFTPDDQRIFNQYLQFCGIGLRNAQLFERSQLENKRNQVLLDLARMVFEEQSTIEHIVYRIMVHIQSLLGCERCQVLLVSESSDNHELDSSNEVDMNETELGHFHHGDEGPIFEPDSRTFSRVFDLSIDDLKDSGMTVNPDDNDQSKDHNDSNNNNISSSVNRDQPFDGRFPINIGITGYVAATGETLNLPNAYEDSRFDTSVDTFDPRGFVHRSILCMPIRNANRRIIGVSQLVNKLNCQPFNKNDENLFEAFAIFCGMGIHNTQMYEKAMKAMAKQRVTFECLSYHATSRREEAIALSREPIPSTQALRLACLDFHDFSLETDDMMVKACIRMFLDLDLINRFSIDYVTLCRWLLSVRKNYRPVTYHNWRHAFNVAQMMFAILVTTSLCTSLGELDTLALIMACLCHDLDHRGTNNSFQIKSSSPLATLYSTSTMEHHHFDQSLMILNSEGNQILSNLSPAEYKRVVRVMEEAILATDLVVYFTNRNAFVRLIDLGEYCWDSNESDKELLRGMLMTACDIAAITKPWEVQKVVAELVATEFFQQGDIEKEKLNLQPIDMMNRDKKDELPRLQVSFIDSICLPIYSAFSSLYPHSLKKLELGVINNKQNWLYQALEHPTLREWAIEELQKLETSQTQSIQKAS